MLELRAQIQAQLKLADAIRRMTEHAERNGVELDMDLQGNTDELKRLLEKAKRNGGLGGLAAFGDLDLDWVGLKVYTSVNTPQIENQNRKVKSVAIFFYETSL